MRGESNKSQKTANKWKNRKSRPEEGAHWGVKTGCKLRIGEGKEVRQDGGWQRNYCCRKVGEDLLAQEGGLFPEKVLPQAYINRRECDLSTTGCAGKWCLSPRVSA